MTRIIGIDPGLASTGYGVIDYDGTRCTLVECGTVVTTPKQTTAARLREIDRVLREVVRRTTPMVFAIEGLFFVQNVTSGIAVAQGRGVAILAAVGTMEEINGVEPECGEYTPMQIKQAVVGYGKATKAQIAQMVAKLLGIDDLKAVGSNHAADALAIAICHAHTSGFRKAAQKQLGVRSEELGVGRRGDEPQELNKALLSQMRTRGRRGGKRS